MKWLPHYTVHKAIAQIKGQSYQNDYQTIRQINNTCVWVLKKLIGFKQLILNQIKLLFIFIMYTCILLFFMCSNLQYNK